MVTEEVLKIKENVTIDEFDTSSKQRRYLLRYDDNQWQVSEPIRDVICSIDGKRDIEAIYTSISAKYQDRVSLPDVENIITLLRERGILVGTTNQKAGIKKNINFWLRITIIKASLVQKLLFLTIFYDKRILRPLGIICFVSLIWMIVENTGTSTIERAFHPSGSMWLFMLGLVPIMTLWHELGHSAASMKYGVKPGNIGFGIYYIIPVCFSDNTAIWKLSRSQRFIVDMGGMYFQSIFLLVICVIAIFTSNIDLKLFILIASVHMLFNFNPFIKMDGYWILSDLTGIPNLHESMKNFLISNLKKIIGKEGTPYRLDIKPKEKLIFYVYITLCFIFLIWFFCFMVIIFKTAITNLPEMSQIFVMANYNGKTASEVFSFIIGYVFSNLTYFISILILPRIVLRGRKVILKLLHKREKREKCFES